PHFLVVGVRLLALGRNCLDPLRPFVQRVGQLAIVHHEWGNTGQMIFRGLLQVESPYGRGQTYALRPERQPLAQAAVRGWCSADDVGDPLPDHGRGRTAYSKRAASTF